MRSTRLRPGMRFVGFGAAVQRYRYVIMVAALAVVVVASFGIRRIVIQDSWIDGFAPGSEFHKATSYFNDQFLGTHILLVSVDAGGGKPITGELDGAAVDHHWIDLPGDLVDDPTKLDGWHIFVRRADVDVSSRDLKTRRGVRYTFESRIASPVREGDRIRVVTERRRGSPKLSLRLSPRQKVWYELTAKPMTRPDVLLKVEALEAFLRSHHDQAVGGVIGAASYISTIGYMARARREEERRIPDSPDRIDWLWKQYGRVRGEKQLRQVVTDDYSKTLVTVFLKNANFVDTARLMDSIREYEKEHLAPHGISLSFAGDVAVSQALIKAIVGTQVRSLLVSLMGILLITAILARSFGWGVLCVLPCALAVLVNFAVMGFVGMPLGVATSMFTGMTLGIGVDYAIHLMERYRRSRLTGLDVEAALTDAMRATGPAIAIDAIAVALGFGVMMLSQVPANARLGGLVVLSIINCFAATMFLLPALLRIFARRSRIAQDDAMRP